jgi:hypothetical protein
MTAAMRKQRDRAAAAAAAPHTCSSSITVSDSDSDDENDKLPLTVWMSRWAQQSSLSQSTTPAVVRRAMSDITNVNNSNFSLSRHAQHNQAKRSFYQRVRAQLAHPDDNTMCAYCGEREHTALHHEDDFKRAGTAVSNSDVHSNP